MEQTRGIMANRSSADRSPAIWRLRVVLTVWVAVWMGKMRGGGTCVGLLTGEAGDCAHDYQGSLRLSTDGTGTLLTTRDYMPFGDVAYEWTKQGAEQPEEGFAYYAKDSESELYYARNRYYDSNSCSFTQQDSIKADFNWYGYCEGLPNMLSDPWGLKASCGLGYDKEDDQNYQYASNDNSKEAKKGREEDKKHARQIKKSIEIWKYLDKAFKAYKKLNPDASFEDFKNNLLGIASKNGADLLSLAKAVYTLLARIGSANNTNIKLAGIAIVLAGVDGPLPIGDLIGTAIFALAMAMNTADGFDPSLWGGADLSYVPIEDIEIGSIYIPVVDENGNVIGGVVIKGHVDGGAIGELICNIKDEFDSEEGSSDESDDGEQ